MLDSVTRASARLSDSMAIRLMRLTCSGPLCTEVWGQHTPITAMPQISSIFVICRDSVILLVLISRGNIQILIRDVYKLSIIMSNSKSCHLTVSFGDADDDLICDWLPLFVFVLLD